MQPNDNFVTKFAELCETFGLDHGFVFVTGGDHDKARVLKFTPPGNVDRELKLVIEALHQLCAKLMRGEPTFEGSTFVHLKPPTNKN